MQECRKRFVLSLPCKRMAYYNLWTIETEFLKFRSQLTFPSFCMFWGVTRVVLRLLLVLYLGVPHVVSGPSASEEYACSVLLCSFSTQIAEICHPSFTLRSTKIISTPICSCHILCFINFHLLQCLKVSHVPLQLFVGFMTSWCHDKSQCLN